MTDRLGGSNFSGERLGGAAVYTTSDPLDEVIAVFDDLLLMPDHGAILVALAAIVANYADGDVVWPLLVGPPGCGKSEIVNATTMASGVWALSSLTPQTLLSGFERKGEPASLLLQIGKFGILAFKDLTTVLTMAREAKAQIIGQLREVADGKTEKSFGNGLRLEWEGKLGLIAGVTPVIDEQHSFLSIMGERFLLYRMPEVHRRDLARRSLARRGHESELRTRIRATVADFLEPFRGCGRLDLPESFEEPLVELTDIITRARSGVARDGYSRELLYMPEPEAPTRLAKQLAQLGASLLALGSARPKPGGCSARPAGIACRPSAAPSLNASPEPRIRQRSRCSRRRPVFPRRRSSGSSRTWSRCGSRSGRRCWASGMSWRAKSRVNTGM